MARWILHLAPVTAPPSRYIFHAIPPASCARWRRWKAEKPFITQDRIEKSMTIHILLADDHTILRAGLKMMLNAQPDMEVIGEARDGRQAIAEGQLLEPDIVLMDITMPDMNGIEATRQIKKLQPETKVLMLTMHENDEYVFQALRAGA